MVWEEEFGTCYAGVLLSNPAYEPSDVAACEQLDLASFGLPELMANDRSVAPAVAWRGPDRLLNSITTTVRCEYSYPGSETRGPHCL